MAKIMIPVSVGVPDILYAAGFRSTDRAVVVRCTGPEGQELWYPCPPLKTAKEFKSTTAEIRSHGVTPVEFIFLREEDFQSFDGGIEQVAVPKGIN